MVTELQEFLHFVAQQMIFFLTLAQLLIFVAMGGLFRGKRNSLPRYIAGALQLFVINGIAWYSALWGFIAFLSTYALSFVWHYKSRPRMLQQLAVASDKNAAVTEVGDETVDADAIDNIDDLDRYENIDDTKGGAP